MLEKNRLIHKAYIPFLVALLLFVSFGAGSVFAQQYKSESNQVKTRVGNPAEDATTGQAGKFTFYCQADPQWNSPNYNCAMKDAGCGPTSMAMVLTYFGNTMNPQEVDQIFGSRKWRTCGNNESLMPAAIQTLLPEKGYDVEALSVPLNLTKAKEYIEKGYLIIGSVSIHIFVIDEVYPERNAFRQRDPITCNAQGWIERKNDAPWVGASGTRFPWYYAFAVRKKGITSRLSQE